VTPNTKLIYIVLSVLIALYGLSIVIAAYLRVDRGRDSWVSIVVIIFWIVLYGLSITMAACLREPHASKISRRLKNSGFCFTIIRWLLSVLPYFICITPHFFPPYRGISGTVSWILVSLILTWTMIVCTRKQLFGNENRE
jgi:hypothetical protein